jgi:hypothetical protein
MMRPALLGLLGGLALCISLSPAHAQGATRTWMSGAIGNDSNPCSYTQPCATFAVAIGKTATGGEISILDPGDFGPVTIAKAISIYNDGVGEAGILATSGSAIVISAGSTDVVNLRGLILNGVGTGLYGIEVTSAGTVNVQNSVVQGFASGGIFVLPSSGTTAVKIQDSTVIHNNTGLEFKPTGGAIVNAEIDRVRIDENSGGGIRADGSGGGPVTVAVSDTSISENASNGVNAVSGSSGDVTMDLTRALIASNGIAGVQSTVKGGTSTVTVGESLLSNNGSALDFSSGGSLLSFGNNQVTGSAGSGFSSSIAPE